MANKNITIPITDHADNCSQYYLVEYKLSTELNYSSFQWFDDQIIISNVADASTYDVRITRYCCNGGVSAPLVLSVDTTSDSPQLDTPINLVLTPGSGSINCDCDDVTDATEYVFEIAQDAAFTVHFEQYVSATSDHNFTGLPSAILHYVRVKARASGFADSAYSDVETATTS